MRNPYLIHVAEERNTHMFFEETAEIFSAESNLICYFFELKFLGIMFIYIRDDFPQSIIRLAGSDSYSRK